MAPDNSATIMTNEIAERLGVDRKTVQVWCQKGMPSIGRGKYEIDALWWIIAHYQNELKRTAPTQDSKDIKLQHESVKLQIDEEKLALVRGENTPNTQIAKSLSQLGFTIKSRLRSLKRLANKLHGLDVVEMTIELEKVSSSILKEISETEVSFDQPTEPDPS